MGATQARFQDAEMHLAVPKYRMVGGRRMLDPSVSECTVCARAFRPWVKKHYCRRCGEIVCERCTALRHYKTPRTACAGFRVCAKCNQKQNLISTCPLTVLRRVLEFSDVATKHHALQTCHRLQLSVPLPEWHIGSGWDAFFGESTFLAKGANGAVYRTSLLPHIQQFLLELAVKEEREKKEAEEEKQRGRDADDERRNGGNSAKPTDAGKQQTPAKALTVSETTTPQKQCNGNTSADSSILAVTDRSLDGGAPHHAHVDPAHELLAPTPKTNGTNGNGNGTVRSLDTAALAGATQPQDQAAFPQLNDVAAASPLASYNSRQRRGSARSPSQANKAGDGNGAAVTGDQTSPDARVPRERVRGFLGRRSSTAAASTPTQQRYMAMGDAEAEEEVDEMAAAISASPAAQALQSLLLRTRGYVAVKVVNKNTMYSVRKWSHMKREVDGMRACKHSHVVDVIAVFQSDESVFVVIEYAPGGDLFDWLQQRQGPSEREVKYIARQLLGALEHMHDACGAVHRDIKPENLLLAKRCRGADIPYIKLADFGFARVFPDSIIPDAVRAARRAGSSTYAGSNGTGCGGSAGGTGAVSVAIANGGAAGGLGGLMGEQRMMAAATPCGTLGFAPPEVMDAYAARKLDPESPAAPMTPIDIMKKTDIFAAGVTICILLTGAEPFPCQSSQGHVEAVRQGLVCNGRHWAHVSHDARELLRKLLAPEAASRPTAFDALCHPWFGAAKSSSGGDRDRGTSHGRVSSSRSGNGHSHRSNGHNNDPQQPQAYAVPHQSQSPTRGQPHPRTAAAVIPRAPRGPAARAGSGSRSANGQQGDAGYGSEPGQSDDSGRLHMTTSQSGTNLTVEDQEDIYKQSVRGLKKHDGTVYVPTEDHNGVERQTRQAMEKLAAPEELRALREALANATPDTRQHMMQQAQRKAAQQSSTARGH